jgi:uncharacterized protein (TIGR00369 family)
MTKMSGIERARTLIGNRRPPGIAEALDFRLTDVEGGFAACEGEIAVHALNPLGFVHGGYIATLLDTACGFAVMSKLDEDRSYTTIEIKVAYHKGITSNSGRVRAEGYVTSIGSRIAFAEARLTGENDELYATASSSLLLLTLQQSWH